MNSAEAREYVRLATTETKGRTKTACDLLIAESVKLSKIEQIVNDWSNGDIEGQDTISAFHLIREILEQG